jgi:hypothetical protein
MEAFLSGNAVLPRDFGVKSKDFRLKPKDAGVKSEDVKLKPLDDGVFFCKNLVKRWEFTLSGT